MPNILPHFYNCVYSRTPCTVKDNIVWYLFSLPWYYMRNLENTFSRLNNITKYLIKSKLWDYIKQAICCFTQLLIRKHFSLIENKILLYILTSLSVCHCLYFVHEHYNTIVYPAPSLINTTQMFPVIYIQYTYLIYRWILYFK